MKRDIEHPKVEGVAMAVVREVDEEGAPAWYVYLINRKEVPLTNVMVTSEGYGIVNDESVKTSALRHYIEVLGPMEYARIERIMEDVFALSNQYWLSFYIESMIFDKRYIFVPESINEENFTEVPLLGKKGVMIE
jgi:hypothetical protein